MQTRPGMGPRSGTIGRHAPESKEPWAPEAAAAYMNILHESRTVADRMAVDLGLPLRPGAGWRHGQDGLERIENLASLVTVDVLKYAHRSALRWQNAALRIRDIDQEDAWVPIPRTPGEAMPFCPFCETLQLRLNRRRGLVRCFMPGCVDTGGNVTRARMEYGVGSDRGILVFDDGTTMTCRNDRVQEDSCIPTR